MKSVVILLMSLMTSSQKQMAPLKIKVVNMRAKKGQGTKDMHRKVIKNCLGVKNASKHSGINISMLPTTEDILEICLITVTFATKGFQ
jgi:hypothetical protein